MTQEANFENFSFVLTLHLILRKVIKFIVEKPSTSEVTSQKPHGAGVENTHPPVPLGLSSQKLTNNPAQITGWANLLVVGI